MTKCLLWWARITISAPRSNLRAISNAGVLLNCWIADVAKKLRCALSSVPKLWNFFNRYVEIPPFTFPKPGRQDFTSIPHDAEIVKLLDLRAKLHIGGYKVTQRLHQLQNCDDKGGIEMLLLLNNRIQAELDVMRLAAISSQTFGDSGCSEDRENSSSAQMKSTRLFHPIFRGASVFQSKHLVKIWSLLAIRNYQRSWKLSARKNTAPRNSSTLQLRTSAPWHHQRISNRLSPSDLPWL